MNTYPKTFEVKRGQPVPPTFTKISSLITEALKKLQGNVSDQRQHAVDSQLRTILLSLGFRAREIKGQKLTPLELAKQVEASFAKLNGNPPPGREQYVYSHTISVLTNLEAELDFGGMPDAPPDLPEAPEIH